MSGELTHFDDNGRARMVDVGLKADTVREARAQSEILMYSALLAKVKAGNLAKGDVLGVAQVAGIMAAKKTSELIPLCHPLALTGINLDFEFRETVDLENNKVNLLPLKLNTTNLTSDATSDTESWGAVIVTATVKTKGPTGVEMEALTAVSIAALTIYDMCKAVQKNIIIKNTRLVFKSGGKSGTIEFPAE